MTYALRREAFGPQQAEMAGDEGLSQAPGELRRGPELRSYDLTLEDRARNLLVDLGLPKEQAQKAASPIGVLSKIVDTLRPPSPGEMRADFERRVAAGSEENLYEFGSQALPTAAFSAAGPVVRGAAKVIGAIPKTGAAGLAAIGLGASSTEAGPKQAPSESVMKLQQELRDAGYYTGPIDGVLSPDGPTAKAKERFEADERAKRKEEIDRARLELQQAQTQAEKDKARAALEETARKARAAEQKAKERAAGEERLRQVEENLTWWQDAVRNYGTYTGVGLGVLLGGVTRYGIVKGQNALARRAAGRADKLMEGGRDWASRQARVNQFWSEGQSGFRAPRTPFEAAPGQTPSFRASPTQAPPASELYRPNKAANAAIDAGALASFGGEYAAAHHMGQQARAELAAARDAMREDPSEANIARFQSARDAVGYWDAAANVGRAAGFTYLGTAPKFRRDKQIRPNVSAAEAERARIDAYLARNPERPNSPTPGAGPGSPRRQSPRGRRGSSASTSERLGREAFELYKRGASKPRD